jgi:hypothetical protein
MLQNRFLLDARRGLDPASTPRHPLLHLRRTRQTNRPSLRRSLPDARMNDIVKLSKFKNMSCLPSESFLGHNVVEILTTDFPAV